MAGEQSLQPLIDALAKASWKERDALKAQLIAACEPMADRQGVLDFLEQSKRGVPSLEVRWEIDEVIELLTPAPEPVEEEPEPEEEPEDPSRPLTASDLDMVYNDPRGLVLHKAKRSDRWFATQQDPATGQPQTFELHPTEVEQLKGQLKGSPYWLLGAGGLA